jgi:hypothetical protein
MLPIYTTICNLVFDDGVIPESWSIGVFGDFVLIIHETVIQCAHKFTTCFIKLVTINIVLEQIINFFSFVRII